MKLVHKYECENCGAQFESEGLCASHELDCVSNMKKVDVCVIVSTWGLSMDDTVSVNSYQDPDYMFSSPDGTLLYYKNEVSSAGIPSNRPIAQLDDMGEWYIAYYRTADNTKSDEEIYREIDAMMCKKLKDTVTAINEYLEVVSCEN